MCLRSFDRTRSTEYVQYSTLQYSTVQYSTVQYSTVQYVQYVRYSGKYEQFFRSLEGVWGRCVILRCLEAGIFYSQNSTKLEFC
jgi:hypothetical protein